MMNKKKKNVNKKKLNVIDKNKKKNKQKENLIHLENIQKMN